MEQTLPLIVLVYFVCVFFPLIDEAVEKGKNEIVQLLLDAGADPNIIASNGVPPLMFAIGASNDQVC